MKEAIVKQDLSVDIIDSPIPEPGEGQVVIKVVVSGSNPKDWYVTSHCVSLHCRHVPFYASSLS
jgi:NADPH:quinone reductase-like Zn-dependent oxidoreductase